MRGSSKEVRHSGSNEYTLALWPVHPAEPFDLGKWVEPSTWLELQLGEFDSKIQPGNKKGTDPIFSVSFLLSPLPFPVPSPLPVLPSSLPFPLPFSQLFPSPTVSSAWILCCCLCWPSQIWGWRSWNMGDDAANGSQPGAAQREVQKEAWEMAASQPTTFRTTF